MITERGRVIALKGDQIWVQTIRQNACTSCSARHGCGQRALASVTAGRANQVLVDNSLGARVGDEVMVAIDESTLLRASLLVYSVPLLGLVLGAVLGHQSVPGSDGPAIVFGGLGLALGFVVVRWGQKHAGASFNPRLMSVETSLSNPTIC